MSIAVLPPNTAYKNLLPTAGGAGLLELKPLGRRKRVNATASFRPSRVVWLEKQLHFPPSSERNPVDTSVLQLFKQSMPIVRVQVSFF